MIDCLCGWCGAGAGLQDSAGGGPQDAIVAAHVSICGLASSPQHICVNKAFIAGDRFALPADVYYAYHTFSHGAEIGGLATSSLLSPWGPENIELSLRLVLAAINSCGFVGDGVGGAGCGCALTA